MKTIIRTVCCTLLLTLTAFAANYTVNSNGSGDFSSIQSCANAMSPGDTCTVYAGKYNEIVTVSAGTAGNYKTISVNGTDVVSVLGFTLASHTKLIGNCPEKQGTKTTAACGFFISNTASPGSHACVEIGASTDVYVVHNNMYACGSGGVPTIGGNCGSGMIHSSTGSSYVYIQGNTLSYAGNVIGGQVGMGMDLAESGGGNHFLVENNDLSHYDLGIKYNNQYGVFRNNSFHDQLETEGCENQHTDMFFSEPGLTTNVQHNVMEGNFQRNAVGPNAKGPLSQDDGCGGACFHLIIRFNGVSRIGSGWITNDKTWPNVKAYNNTYVDSNSDSGMTYGAGNNSQSASNASFLNEIYYYTQSSINDFNPYMCNSTNCDYGHNLYWCAGTCTNIYGHTYGSGSFTSDPRNLNANPTFAKYVGPGSPSNDYHLQSGSPAIGAGTNLTTVSSGCGSSTLTLADASYFQDGYGLSGVQADRIRVGASTTTQISSINYSNNQVTFANPVSCTNGNPVYLYSKSDGVQVLYGSAPDMGAYPYGSGSGGGGSIPTAPSGLSAIVN